uniref:Arkadia (RNF111) N-terminal like PKA signaling regulator 2N n=1 Tax=Callorhinchus milii TaxID=7868 RepID=V9L403_CALMI|eukprot:gi/632980569/ref/XP_007907107.1/ PREDICTED: HAUS augmin-like complex subunit 1 isoform X1 [Callorhinchus milii]
MDTDGGEVYMSLSDLFVDEQVPFYEVNAWTTDVLRRLMEINRERDNHGRQLLEDVRQKTKEYQAEASHMQEVLEESLGLTTNSLSSSGSSLLNSLVDCSLALDLKDTSRTSFVLAMNSLTSELTAAESRAQELEVKALSKKLTDKMVLEQLLEEDLRNVEEELPGAIAKAENNKQNMDFFTKKMKEWKKQQKFSERQLLEAGYQPELEHHALLELSEKLTKLKKEVAPMKAKLNSYLDLVPDPMLAKVKIEEAKLELRKLEELISQRMESLAFVS